MDLGKVERLLAFQYKICYSKIAMGWFNELELKKFQYKICYSKIAKFAELLDVDL